MKVFCQTCDQVHYFTACDVERIVYVLQAELHDIVESQGESVKFMQPLYCLKEHLSASHDSEQYAEHCETMTEARREVAHA